MVHGAFILACGWSGVECWVVVVVVVVVVAVVVDLCVYVLCGWIDRKEMCGLVGSEMCGVAGFDKDRGRIDLLGAI